MADSTRNTKLRAHDVRDLLEDPRDMPAFREWLRREERAGRFPPRIRYSERVALWNRDEVERWLDSRPRGVGRAEPIEAMA